MIEGTQIFHAIPRPKNVLSEYSLVVVDGNGKPHRMLTIFYDELLHELSDGAARTYLNNLLPYFTYLATDTWRQHRNDTWESPPEAVRESVRDYLLRKLQCKVRQSGTRNFTRLQDSAIGILISIRSLIQSHWSCKKWSKTSGEMEVFAQRCHKKVG